MSIPASRSILSFRSDPNTVREVSSGVVRPLEEWSLEDALVRTLVRPSAERNPWAGRSRRTVARFKQVIFHMPRLSILLIVAACGGEAQTGGRTDAGTRATGGRPGNGGGMASGEVGGDWGSPGTTGGAGSTCTPLLSTCGFPATKPMDGGRAVGLVFGCLVCANYYYLTCCGDGCYNLDIDPGHCGGCTTQCPADKPVCFAGACEATPCSVAAGSCADGSCCGDTCCPSGQICCATRNWGAQAQVPELMCVTPVPGQPPCGITEVGR